MFSWLLRVFEELQASKKRKVEKLSKKRKRSENISKIISKKEKDISEKNGVGKKEILKEKSKLLLLRLVRIIVQFLENLILWVVGLLGLHMILIIFAGIVIVIVIMSLIPMLDEGALDSNIESPPTMNSTGIVGSLNWSIDELDKYQHYYTAFDKNLFKIAILTKDSVNGYGFTDTYKTVHDTNVEYTMFRMSLGVQTTETTWQMYSTVADTNSKDVFIDPSDLDTSGDIQGPYQMGSEWTMANSIFSNEIKDKIKTIYTNPKNGGDRHYYPYATAVSVSGTYNKMREQNLSKDKYTDIFKSLAPQFGIVEDFNKFLPEAVVMLMQTAYLSAPLPNEREGICAFICGVWAMSSDNPKDRSFNNYSLDYTDGLYLGHLNHQLYLGVSGNGNLVVSEIHKNKDLRELKLGKFKRIKLNDSFLNKPLVAEVVTKYWSVPAIQNYNNDVIAYSKINSQFVLKGIYGIESFLVGKEIIDYLGSKLPFTMYTGNDLLGDNNTIESEIGVNTLKNMMALSMKPIGRVMYSWGGGRPQKTGIQPKWLQFYETQKARNVKYYFREFTTYGKRVEGKNPVTQTNYPTGSPTGSSNANGLDCSGFVGWVNYNNRHDANEYVIGSGSQVTTLASRGLGKSTNRSSVRDYRPGDVMGLDGHVYMVVGPSEHGGIVLVHASPRGVKLGGFGGGQKTAELYMNKYWPEISNKSQPFNFDTYSNNSYKGDYDQFRWNIIQSGTNGVKDPDGFTNMTAEQILKILFKEGS